MRDRIAERLDRLSIPEPNTGCYLFTGRLDRKGYGQMSVGKHKKRGAHRLAFQAKHGYLTPGLVIDHRCKTWSCVNPDHMEEVTSRVNTLRGSSPPAGHVLQSRCKNGHSFSAANTYVAPDGQRQCRICNKRAQERYRAKLRAKRA